MTCKVALIGPESCGKTTLAQQLQQELLLRNIQAKIVPEYARSYYAARSYQVTVQDIDNIAIGQQQQENQQLQDSPRVLLCDTNLITCKIWAEVAFGYASPQLLKAYPPRHYDITFLLAPDIAWEFDPLRSHPKQRDWLFTLYEQELQQHQIDYKVVEGLGSIRWQFALERILSRLI